MKIECWACLGFGRVTTKREWGYHVQDKCPTCNGSGEITFPEKEDT